MKKIKGAMNPTAFFSGNTHEDAMGRVPTRELIEKFRKQYFVEYDKESTHTDDEIQRFLKEALLHVGNAIVSKDKEKVFI